MSHITVTTTPPASPGPTITHYQQLADDLIRAVDQILTILPQMAEADMALAKFNRGHLNVPEQFMATVIAAVEQLPELQALRKLDPVEGRDTLQFLEAFRAVRDKGIAFASTVKYTYDSRKAGLARAARQVYYLAKGLAREKGSAELDAHIANMARDLGRKGLTKKQLERRAAKQAAAGAEQKEVAAA
jgi:hypothetical protein